MDRFRVIFQGALCLGAVLAVVGGATIGVLHLADPHMAILDRLQSGYQHLMFGFIFLALFTVAAALLELAVRKGVPEPGKPAEAPPPAEAPRPRSETVKTPSRIVPALDSLYHEMKTFIDLEMWELALEKAKAILANYAGTREAELVERNLNELRWKAEPKFVASGKPLSADQQKELREKGLAQMYQHVRTYMDLEMWELARQKAVTIMRNFPDSPEATELMKVYETIEKRARETIGAEKGQN